MVCNQTGCDFKRAESRTAALEWAAMERAAIERIERAAIERAAIERAAIERSAIDRAAIEWAAFFFFSAGAAPCAFLNAPVAPWPCSLFPCSCVEGRGETLAKFRAPGWRMLTSLSTCPNHYMRFPRYVPDSP